jgi:hypothetical protein
MDDSNLGLQRPRSLDKPANIFLINSNVNTSISKNKLSAILPRAAQEYTYRDHPTSGGGRDRQPLSVDEKNFMMPQLTPKF